MESIPILSKFIIFPNSFSLIKSPEKLVANAVARDLTERRIPIKLPLSCVEGVWVIKVITGTNLKLIKTIKPVEIIRRVKRLICSTDVYK